MKYIGNMRYEEGKKNFDFSRLYGFYKSYFALFRGECGIPDYYGWNTGIQGSFYQ